MKDRSKLFVDKLKADGREITLDVMSKLDIVEEGQIFTDGSGGKWKVTRYIPSPSVNFQSLDDGRFLFGTTDSPIFNDMVYEEDENSK